MMYFKTRAAARDFVHDGCKFVDNGVDAPVGHRWSVKFL